MSVQDSFLQEAEAAAMYRHDATPGGTPMLVMEFINGRSLADCLKHEVFFDVDRVLKFGIQICDALATAHGKGIIHRDLKPSNVLL